MCSREAVLVAVIILPVLGLAQQDQKKIHYESAKPTSSAAGSAMYKSYCASCHGIDGKGHGPASGALKRSPTDLTSLARQNKGVFPREDVRNAIRGDLNVAAHGSKEMPVWGDVFLTMTRSESTGEVDRRIYNLTRYVESLQQK